MIIIYIDIVLLLTLMALTIGTCVYCFVRVHRLRQSGQIPLLLRPTKVVFRHQQKDGSSDELRSVVAYQNPFTGDYCVHKSRATPSGYLNRLDSDSGLSDQYEPCIDSPSADVTRIQSPMKQVPAIMWNESSVDRPRNWNYNEYQI